MKGIHQILTSLTYGDAISDEALEIMRIVKEQGLQSYIFSYYFHPKMAHLRYRKEDFFGMVSSDDILVFHFSIGSPISSLYLFSRQKKILIYHNITPYEYFIDYQRDLAKFTYLGRKELEKFAPVTDLGLGDSSFNREELEASGYRKTGVLPVIRDFSKFDKAENVSIEKIYRNKKTTIIFVGRIIPNKKFEDLIRVFYLYKKMYNQNSQLILIGEHGGFERYYYSLLNLIEELKLKDVIFPGHVTFDELSSFYRISDLFLCLSEHEGFCVPILEAFYHRIPVIAFNSSAVSETMNGGGTLIENKDYEFIACLIDVIINNEELRDKIIKSQDEAMEKYKMEKLKNVFLGYIDIVENT
ncbi:MAG: glycosyltransferase family 4 protein [Acidobacteriota bacterium]